jgi:hypothetical protein
VCLLDRSQRGRAGNTPACSGCALWLLATRPGGAQAVIPGSSSCGGWCGRRLAKSSDVARFCGYFCNQNETFSDGPVGPEGVKWSKRYFASGVVCLIVRRRLCGMMIREWPGSGRGTSLGSCGRSERIRTSERSRSFTADLHRRSDMTLGALRKELGETGIKDLIEKGHKK